ncbi:MAG: ATP-binding protein [Defluviitaleaceae bacterium]|nr:ATP-binding protein [Defluviitaleaceae bacterium]
MKKYISNLSIAKKLRLSFLLITGLFLLIIIYNIYFTSTTQATHGYFVNYVMERNRILTELQVEFRILSNTIRSTLNDATWRATADEPTITQLNYEIAASVYLLQAMAEDYLDSIIRDYIISDIMQTDVQHFAQHTMQYVLDNIQSIYHYYIVPYHAFNRDYEFFDIILRYTTPVIDAIEIIRNLNLDVIQVVATDLHNQQSYHFAFNLLAFILVAIVTFFIVAWLINNFKMRMQTLKTSAISLKSGEFDKVDKENYVKINDEIGDLTEILFDVNSTVENLVDQIYNTSTEIVNGNFSKRIKHTDFSGNYAKVANSINNLTRIVMSATSLKAEKDYYDYMLYLVDKAPIIITIWSEIGEDFEIINCNEEVMRRYKIDSKEEYKQNFHKFSPKFQPNGENSIELAKKLLFETIEKGSNKFEWLHQDIDGTEIPSEISCYTSTFMGNRTIFSFCSDLRHVYEIVAEKERSASVEANSKAKTQFLARMSHEIRTPINAVLGISEIQLQNPDMDMATEEAFAKIYNSSQILLGLINDILDLSRIESGKMPVLQEQYEMASLINDVIQLNLFRLGSKQIKFDVFIDENIPTLMIGDELRIKQLLNNLLSNAFKYTEHGSVVLAIKFNKINNEDSFISFTIQDTGIGMSKENLKRLFQEFARFDEEKARHIEGTGLGMAIVQNLVELINAKIDVQSELGVGTTIKLDIPQKIASDSVIGTELANNLKGSKMSSRFARKNMNFKPEPMPYGKVLVVDDVETNLFVAKGLLAFYSIQVETCDRGHIALDLVKQGKVYDIIFLDHMMPDMDGIETAEKIRQAGYTEPLVALTATALIGQSEEFLQNGFDGFISKPIDTSHLNALLHKFIRGKQPPEVIEAAHRNAENAADTENDKNNQNNQNNKNNNQTAATGSDIWDFFSGNATDDNATKFFNDLRKEFSRSQRHIIWDIRQALEKKDLFSCRRFAHTLKGLAHTIKESDLAETAGRLETLFEQDKICEEIFEKITLMEQQLTAVIATIPKDENGILAQTAESPENAAPALTAEEITETLLNLRPLLEESSMESLNVVQNLEKVPQATILVYRVQNFDFDNALKDLAVLLEILG